MSVPVVLPPLEAVEVFEAGLAGLRASLSGLWQLSEADLAEFVSRVCAADGPYTATQLDAIREFDVRGVAKAQGAVSTRSYLAGSQRLTGGAAGERVRLAEAFAGRYAATGAALAASAVVPEQAKAIVDMLDRLSAKGTAAQLADAEAFLLEQAGVLDAADLRRLEKGFADTFDPDGTPDREDAARRKRGAVFKDHHDGSQTFSWTDTDENMAIAKAAFGPLLKPVPSVDGQRDPRASTVRRADAAVEVCRRALRAGDMPRRHGVRPHLTVSFTDAALRGDPGAFGRTATGEQLSAFAIARLICDSSLTALLVDEHGIPLKLGRTERTVSPGQWIALVARDIGCQFPGCTLPADYCEAHHLPPWSADGQTDLDKLGLYCAAHHHFLHEGGWQARMGADGRPEVLPPPWIDPLRTPRRNLHWRAQQEFLDFTTGVRKGQSHSPHSSGRPEHGPEPGPAP